MQRNFYYQRSQTASDELVEQRKLNATEAFKGGIKAHVLNTSGLIKSSVYKEVPEQENALASLYAAADACRAEIISSAPVFTIDGKTSESAITETVIAFKKDDDTPVYAKFYTGLTPIMLSLIESNSLCTDSDEVANQFKSDDIQFVIGALDSIKLTQCSTTFANATEFTNIPWFINEAKEFIGITIEPAGVDYGYRIERDFIRLSDKRVEEGEAQ